MLLGIVAKNFGEFVHDVNVFLLVSCGCGHHLTKCDQKVRGSAQCLFVLGNSRDSPVCWIEVIVF